MTIGKNVLLVNFKRHEHRVYYKLKKRNAATITGRHYVNLNEFFKYAKDPSQFEFVELLP